MVQKGVSMAALWPIVIGSLISGVVTAVVTVVVDKLLRRLV